MAQADAKRFEDKDFVLTFFNGVESGQDVSQRLVQNSITLSAPDLICNLVGWLAETDDTDSEARERARQELVASGLSSPASPLPPSSETSSAPSEAPASSEGKEQQTSSPTSETAGETAKSGFFGSQKTS